MHINAYKNTVCEVAELVIQQQTCVELSGTLMEFPGCQGTICSCPTRLMSHMWIRPASHQISAVAYLHLITETENILLIHTQLKLTIMLTHTHTHRVNTYSFSKPHINQKDIDWSSCQPCNCLPCCQSFDAILLCSNQSSDSKAPVAL